MNANCRDCNQTLSSVPGVSIYDAARNPKTGEVVYRHYYGGICCSKSCEDSVTRKMNKSIDAHFRGSGAK